MTDYGYDFFGVQTGAARKTLIAYRDEAGFEDTLQAVVKDSNDIVLVAFGDAVPPGPYTHAILMMEPADPVELMWWHDEFKTHLSPDTVVFELGV